MKEVWFYTFWTYQSIGGMAIKMEKPTYSENFDSFEEAWNSRESCRFPESPVMKGYVKED